MKPYRDGYDHLRHELSRLDLLLRRALFLARGGPSGPAAYRGLLISEAEIDTLLETGELLGQGWRRAERHERALRPLTRQAARLREEIAARCDLSERAGVSLPLVNVSRLFGLSPMEIDLVLVALAPEIETRYEALYAYLQDDVQRKRPGVNLALDLLCDSERQKLAARKMLLPQAPLVRHRLIRLGDLAHEPMPTLLRRFVKLDESLIAYLLELTRPADSPGVLQDPEPAGESMELDDIACRKLSRLAAELNANGRHSVAVHLSGDAESTLLAAAEVLAHALDRRLLLCEFELAEGNAADLPALLREAILHHAIPAIRTPARSGQAGLETSSENMWREVSAFQSPVVFLGPRGSLTEVPPEIALRRVEVPSPEFHHRREVWSRALNGRGRKAEIERLADSFRFAGRRIHQTVDLATGLARLRDPTAREPLLEELFEAGRSLSGRGLTALATRIEPRQDWSDIVLPDEKLQQLKGIATRVEHRRMVHGDWGFGRKLVRSRGVSALFTGPSGTGKTMAAEIVAGHLALELIQIDLACVVSKYIGETEKNLSAIFRGAEECQAVLFFDEADALFGKRTEVRDAHDRYANIEVNYLLQRVEQYDGIVVLATNFQDNLDKAFLRRIHELVEFPFPGSELRTLIWKTHFPPEAPRSDDIDFEFLGEQFKLTGGSIRNVVLGAAARAAREESAISMRHLVLAIKAELQKQGKLSVRSDFGPYYELVRS